MAEPFRPTEENRDEVSLVAVFDRSSRFISRYKWVLIVCVLLGLGTGLLLGFLKPKSYDCTLLLQSQVLTNAEEIQIIASWDDLVKGREYNTLARIFAVPVTVTSAISTMVTLNVPSPLPSSSQTPMPILGFTIHVIVNDTTVLPQVQQGIVHGLESGDFVRRKVAFKKASAERMIVNISDEIARLDSFKRRMESGDAGKHASNPVIVSAGDANMQMVHLRERLDDYLEDQEFINAVQVLQDFQLYSQSGGLHRSTLVFAGLVGGLFIGFVVSFYKYMKYRVALFRNGGPSAQR